MANWVEYKSCFPFKRKSRLRNAEPEAIIEALSDLQKLCEANAEAKHGLPLVVFLYYSGHGIMVDGELYIICSNGSPVNIDRFIKASSLGKHIKYIALLDCCREAAQVGSAHKGAAADTAGEYNQQGERFVIYSSEARDRAVSTPEGSLVTNSFLRQIVVECEKNNDFRAALSSWEMKKPGGAVIND